MDDIELYEFFKDFSCKHFDLNYSHDVHSWNIRYGDRNVKISKDDLIKLELELNELRLKYFPKQKPLEYIPEEKH